MRHAVTFLVVLALLVVIPTTSFGASSRKSNRQIGIGLGTANPYPLNSSASPYAMVAILEGTYRMPFFGLSIVATATSSQNINGTYWFGSQGGYQQTFIEPRIYLSIFQAGVAVGLILSDGTTGQIQSAVSYGPMAGIEIPIGRFSIGANARYIMTQGTNPAPLSTVLMFRFPL